MSMESWLPFICSVVCAFLAGMFSYLGARYSARKDIRKLKLEWEQQRVQQSDQEFAEMLRLVNERLDNPSVPCGKASAAVALVRSKATGAYGDALDDLHQIVSSAEIVSIPSALDKVLRERSLLQSKPK